MKLDKIFSSHMVFSANKPIRIYGGGKGQATVVFNGVEKNVISDSDEWLVEFQPMNYGGPYELKFIYNSKESILDDIYVGEVYLFSGQSNMGLKIKETNVTEEEYVDINKLRLFSVDKFVGEDFFGADDGWVKCKKDDVNEWPALAYLSGRKLVQERNIAIGIISCSQGASVIESWVPKDTFRNIGIDIPVDKKMSDHIDDKYKIWNVDAKLYETQLLQAVPFQISAVVWYQGESDTSYDEASVYDKELCALIDIWRSDFKNDTLPFVIVQIADFCYTPNLEAWKLIQEAQYRVQTMKENVKTVISRDVCENNDIHPKTKDKLSERITTVLLEL